MGRRRLGGYIFDTFSGDHLPYHVHIKKGEKQIGRWDIENQVPWDGMVVTKKLRNALVALGYARR
jgi:hypothetical protein